VTSFQIQSLQNRKYKLWRRWAVHPEATDCPWIPITGLKQIRDIISFQSIELLLHTDSVPSTEKLRMEQKARKSVLLPERLMDRIVPIENSQGLLAFIKKPKWDWSDLTSFVIILDRIQDPGNLGTIFRTAAATGIFTIITTPGTVSVFNTKALRASSGLLFKVPHLIGKTIPEILERNFNIYAADAEGKDSVFETEFIPPLALILGNEGQGILLEEDLKQFLKVKIPMAESTDSLNVGVCGSIIMYEIFRRNLHG